MTKVLIWDTEENPPSSEGITVLWRSIGSNNSLNIISIPLLIENNAEMLRNNYLAWIYEFSKTKIRNTQLINYLEIRTGFSYWWMTLLAQKCNISQSPQINDAIRLLAFEQWMDKRKLSSITLISSNKILAKTLKDYCIKYGLLFAWEIRPIVKKPYFGLKSFYKLLPNTIKSFAWLFLYLVKRWPLKGVGIKEWHLSKGKITFFSYLFNLTPSSCKKGVFESNYWGPLPRRLSELGTKTNWLHLYLESDYLPTAALAAKTILKFNKQNVGDQIHVTLDSFLSLSVVFKTIFDLVRLFFLSMFITNIKVNTKITKMNLWNLFCKEWLLSFRGPTAVSNVLNINLFETAMKSQNNQKFGVYLQENQGWEFSMIHAWRLGGHKQLIGFPHATIRFWDLRNFFAPQSYYNYNNNGVLRPDLVAINGPNTKIKYVKGGYPEDELVEVESLRYFHLLKTDFTKNQQDRNFNKSIKVLILSDYLKSVTQKQIRLLEKASDLMPPDTVFTVKPHLSCPVDPSDYPGIKMNISMEPIGHLLAENDVAYSSYLTSAAVDAYCAGISVVLMLDPETLNLSPLRGCEGAIFINNNAQELANALLTSSSSSLSSKKVKNFFTLDENLSRWLKVLEQ